MACGMRIENRMSCPAANALSSEKSTPLAEMFRVRAGTSPAGVESTTGRARGNRTAHRTSCRPLAVACAPNGSRASAFCSVIRFCPIGMGLVVTVASFIHLAQGTKVSRLVTGRASFIYRPPILLHMILCVSAPMTACGSGAAIAAREIGMETTCFRAGLSGPLDLEIPNHCL
jgi:hypothetical protein